MVDNEHLWVSLAERHCRPTHVNYLIVVTSFSESWHGPSVRLAVFQIINGVEVRHITSWVTVIDDVRLYATKKYNI